MSDEMKDGGPAFPVVESDQMWPHPGMSLRDWFAGSCPYETAFEIARGCVPFGHSPTARDVAVARYRYADAMLMVRDLEVV